MDKDQPSRKDRQSKLDPKNKKHSTLSRRHRDANHPHAHQESFDSKSRHQRRLERIAQLEKRQGGSAVASTFQSKQSDLNRHVALQERSSKKKESLRGATQSVSEQTFKARPQDDDSLASMEPMDFKTLPPLAFKGGTQSSKVTGPPVRSHQTGRQSHSESLKAKPFQPANADSLQSQGPGKDDHTLQANPPQSSKTKKKQSSNQYSLEGYTLKEKTGIFTAVFFNLVRRFILLILVVGTLLAALMAGTGIGYFASLVGETEPPSREEMAEAINRLDQQSTLYYASKEPIANVRSDVVRSVASLEDISPHIIQGLISIEDQNFYDHPGVNPKSTLRAILQTFLTGSGTGGSTLTQQLVKQQLLTHDVTFFRKANEILLSLRLEKYLSKDEILTAYLNVSPFGRNNKGENIAGIREASEGIFGISPADVNLNQAAFLVGLPQNPYTYTPYNQYGERSEDMTAGITRMKNVLYSMYRNQYIDKDTYDKALQYDITKDFIKSESRPKERQTYLYQAVMNAAVEKIMALNIKKDGNSLSQVYQDVDWYNDYYFAAERQLRTGGYKVYSTIDKEIYNQLQISAKEHESQLGPLYEGVYTDPNTGEEIYYVEKPQSGVVVMENATGKVLGFVAGTDFESNQIDHAFRMHRSPGSTIKPLAVYGPALEQNIITPASIIPDTELVETYADGTEWRPTNYGNVISNKFYTARTSLQFSYNLPTIRIYQALLNQGVPISDYLTRMGFNPITSYTPEETHNLAFSIGGVTNGPTVFEQTSAFTTFANQGKHIEGYLIEKIEDAYGNIVFQQESNPQQVFSEDTNYLMVDMLRDVNRQGTGGVAASILSAIGGDWIAKTGTSESLKDIWYIASTPKITIGSWIGYDNQYGEYFIDPADGYGQEGTRSQQFWGKLVSDLYAIRPEIFGIDQQFQQPASVVRQSVVERTGTQPGSVTVNYQSIPVTGPLKDELFKASYPAPQLSADFMISGSERDYQLFWGEILRRFQESQTTSKDATEESSEEEDEDEENPDDPDHSTPPDLYDPSQPEEPYVPEPVSETTQ